MAASTLPSPYIRNIARDMILSIITCGLFNIYVQDRQIQALNQIVGQPKYSFTRWAVLTLVTCGIYHVYHEYRMTTDLQAHVSGVQHYEPMLAVVLSFLGFTILVDAIQQSQINRYFGSQAV